MSSTPLQSPLPRLVTIVAFGASVAVLALAAPASAHAQGRRRCPTCAEAPERTPSAPGATNRPARRGAPGAPAQPMTAADVTLGGAHYAASVDAECAADPRATSKNTRFYYRVMYPWFGQRVGADKPQWRFTLEIRPAAASGAYDQFVFSFHDGAKSGTIQKVSFGERMGSGTVRVTRHGNGARFEVAGRTEKGQAVRATFDCSQFQGSEEAGG